MIVHDPERRAEREALLARVVAVLTADSRVCAAWLIGSLGRGDADDLSDIDVWVIVADEYADSVKVAQQEYVTQIGLPLQIEEAPQNAPPNGAYLCAIYPGQTGAHVIDWYWQPRTGAQLPANCRVLFDRAGIPPSPPEKALSAAEHGSAATDNTHFFWGMVNIAAKTIARRQPWSALGHITTIRFLLDEVRWHVGKRSTRPDYKLIKTHTDLPPVLPLDQLAVVRYLAYEMEGLHPAIAALGGHVPDAVIAPTFAFLDHVEGMLKDFSTTN